MSSALTSGAGGGGGFAAQLDWLLRSVPRHTGSSARFNIEDLVSALATEGLRAADWAARSHARAWLTAVRTGRQANATALDRRNMAILEALFRLPTGYFRDESIRQATDERIIFAADATERGVTVIGPCRVRTSLLDIETLHSIHLRARAELDRRTGT